MKPTTNWSRFVLRIAVLILGAMTVSPARAQKWTEELSAAPIPRGFTTAVLDSQTNRMVIFGGGGPSMDLNDVWVLIDASGPASGTSWLQLQPTGSAPAPRVFPTAIYDQTSNRMTIFGGGEGSSSPCVNDVWVLENANGLGGTPTWIPLSPSGTAPSPRGALSSIFDSNTDRMTIFGGQNCFSTNFNDVWVLTQANGIGGTPTWIQLTPAGTPPSPRSNPGGVGYDPATNRMILFGGEGSGGVVGDVWVLTNANGLGGTPTWIQLAPAGTPPQARVGHTTVYDPASNRLIIFAGESNVALLNDAWVLTHANGVGGVPTWTQITTSGTMPAARADHSAVYDSAKNRMVVFGGVVETLSGPQTINDVFVLTRANNK